MRTTTAIPPSHTKRLVHTAFGWYAMTREQSDLGPFASQQEASNALSRHIRVYRGVNIRGDGAAHSGLSLHDSASCRKSNCALCAEAHVLRQTLVAS
ncbi:hypothetical protein DYI22_08605 [Marinobacter lipolyticus]|uniref:DUF6316 family protein n=1 Tax=Marinobacter lipolyticus TaxID=209639 RepID=UPI001BCE1E8D|nr:DUF6316 family protein [Marinobacter lipolyticus]MBS8240566.1 hypothetical protein [Marinobacter lipolyticus]